MAFIYVDELPELSQFQGNNMPAPTVPALASYRVANNGASTQGQVFNSKTRLIRVHSDSVCSIEVGANPTATTSSARLAANTTQFFTVTPGHRIAAVLNT